MITFDIVVKKWIKKRSAAVQSEISASEKHCYVCEES